MLYVQGYRSRNARPLYLKIRWLENVLGKTDVGSSAAEKRPIPAVLRAAFVVNEEVARRHGQWWDSRMKDSWGSVSGAPADGVHAAIGKEPKKNPRRKKPFGKEPKKPR